LNLLVTEECQALFYIPLYTHFQKNSECTGTETRRRRRRRINKKLHDENTELFYFVRHTFVNNWWQIRKTSIVAEISSATIYCILPICMALRMSRARAI
jgi:hypothetical protein